MLPHLRAGTHLVFVASLASLVGTYAYAATTTGTSYTVTPTCATADSITVNGNTVASGVASSAIATASVGNYALQVVTIKAGYISRTYNITVVKTS